MEMCVNLWVHNRREGSVFLHSEPITFPFGVCSIKAVFIVTTLMIHDEDTKWWSSKTKEPGGNASRQNFLFCFYLRTYTLRHTQTCEVSIKARTLQVNRKSQRRRHTEKLVAERFSSLTLSPDLCTTCRGRAAKGAVLFWGGKKNPSKIQSWGYLKGLLPVPPTPTVCWRCTTLHKDIEIPI